MYFILKLYENQITFYVLMRQTFELKKEYLIFQIIISHIVSFVEHTE